MAKKTLRSAADAAEEQLKAGAKKLQAQLGTVEKAAGKLATEARKRLPAPVDVKSELPGVRRRLRNATASVAKRKDRGATPPRPATASTPRPAAASKAAKAAKAPKAPKTPDASWTVADLRAEAKRRGMTGYSTKTKAQLLAQLRR